MAVKQSSRGKSYLEFMSKYTPNLWRMRFDLFLLFTLISLGLHLAGYFYQYGDFHQKIIAGAKFYSDGFSTLNVAILSLYWIVPVLLVFALGYWICRSVRVREIVGTRNKPLCTSLAVMFSIIFVPKIFYKAYVGDSVPSDDTVMVCAYIVVSFLLACAVFVKSITLSKLSTTIYGFIFAIIFVIFLIISFFAGFSILDHFLSLFYMSDDGWKITFTLFGIALLFPPVILAMRATAKTQGRFSSLSSITALWCLIFAFVTFVIDASVFAQDVERYIYQGLLAAALPPCVDLLSGFIAKRLALPKKA